MYSPKVSNLNFFSQTAITLVLPHLLMCVQYCDNEAGWFYIGHVQISLVTDWRGRWTGPIKTTLLSAISALGMWTSLSSVGESH